MSLHGHASEYPDNMIVSYEYPDGRLLIYENYPFTAYGMHGFDNGNVFYGTEGYMIFSRRGAFSVFLGRKGKPGPNGRQRNCAANVATPNTWRISERGSQSNHANASSPRSRTSVMSHLCTLEKLPTALPDSCTLITTSTVRRLRRGQPDADQSLSRSLHLAQRGLATAMVHQIPSFYKRVKLCFSDKNSATSRE